MRKSFKILTPMILFILGFLLWSNRLPDWNAAEELPWKYRFQIQQEIHQAEALLEGASAPDIDTMETLLMEAGYSVLDTDAIYPTYLANPDTLTDFWINASAGQNASCSFFHITEESYLRHLFFLHENNETRFFTADIILDESQRLSVLESEALPVYDMELTNWGIFYYRLYPAGDPHYIDYSQIRLHSVDQNLYDLNRKYILPVGYQMVNLFLCDWQEGNWGDLSFQDTLESLYCLNTGASLNWEAYPRDNYRSRVRIPAEVFEGAILPYFQISLEEFRHICQYDQTSGTYPWRAVHGDDLTAWKYPMCEPEILSVAENSNGTITLEVQVCSPDLKTNRLFCHTLTVRPLEGDAFQYVANKVTYVSDRGLPPNMPRFELN